MASAVASKAPQILTKEGWITPKEQLKRIRDFTIEEPARIIEQLTGLISVLSRIVAEYCDDKFLEHWYTALEKTNMLSETIPPLPERIIHIMVNGSCPFNRSETMRETHCVYLVPPKPLNELEQIMEAYGKNHLEENRKENPLRFHFFFTPLRIKYGDSQVVKFQWVVISKDIVNGSSCLSYKRQTKMVKKVDLNYRLPRLVEVVAVAWFQKLATRESILQAPQQGDLENIKPYYTHVEETSDEGRHNVVFGNFRSDGVTVIIIGGTYAKWLTGALAVLDF